MEPDFSGYATKNGLKCSDGRIIHSGAFQAQDGAEVPLVWQHQHNDVNNVLGHAKLENREDGVYAYGFFNDTENGKTAKSMIQHGDIRALSIYANQLVEKGKNVMHGAIREVSLVLSGANPGAFIDNVNLAHSEDEVSDEAIIYTGLELAHAEDDSEGDEEVAENEKTVKDVYESMTDEQKDVVHFMIGAALEEETTEGGEAAQSDNDDNELYHDEEGNPLTRNVFSNGSTGSEQGPTLTHDQLTEVMDFAKRTNGSVKDSFLAHAGEWGINDIDVLFPDAKNVQNAPEWVKRNTEWVDGVINGTSKSPFSRIKSMSADITHEEARARGYIKGNMKKEEFFGLKSRSTTPTTIYKKQKLDRDDIIDITDLDVVAWLKAEMRMMLNEEIARAILLGDGRPEEDPNNAGQPNPDKINENNIRPIANDDHFYAHQVSISTSDADSDANEIIEAVIRARKHYKGKGTPAFYTTEDVITDMLLYKDQMGRRVYKSEADLASDLRVSKLIPVEAMEEENNQDIIGIMVNISDYTVGSDKGGKVSMFDDFDIDFNQYKYLIEGRLSGALTRHKTAVVFKRAASDAVTPTAPTATATPNEYTIPTITGVEYRVDGQVVTGTLTITEDTLVEAFATDGYYIADGATSDWLLEYTA